MVTTNAVQLFGGYGYCKDYPIEKYMRGREDTADLTRDATRSSAS
jgi:alkylation response protein AidB-like acyl-CoA dehydrogenase